MRYRTLILPLLLLAFPARAEETPMAWAFQHFCADESFTLDEARLAIAVAGGKQHGPTVSTRFPMPISITFWDIVIRGQKVGISLGGQRVPAGPGVADMVTCTVSANGKDDAGIADLRKWAAVAPSMTPARGIAVYRFQSEGGKHIPVPDAGNGDGRVWQLDLIGGNFTTVTLMRFFKTRENS